MGEGEVPLRGAAPVGRRKEVAAAADSQMVAEVAEECRTEVVGEVVLWREVVEAEALRVEEAVDHDVSEK